MSKSKKKRVAILADPLDLQSAGIYVYLVNLISRLNQQSDVEYLLVRAKGGKNNYGLKEHIIKSYKIPGYSTFRKFLLIPFYLYRSSFDAVIEPAHFGPFGNGGQSKKITVIHDLTPILFPSFHPLYSTLLHKLFLSRILKKANLIISNSFNTQKDIEKIYAHTKGKVLTIYPEVSSIFKPADNLEELEQYHIEGEFILSVGTIEPRKNYLTLVKAYELLRDNDPQLNIKLIIVGRKGWKSQGLLNHIKDSKYTSDIRILSNIPTKHLPLLYSRCKLFVYASIYEGFGFPLLEAHNCGAECIAGNNSSLKEIGQSFATYFETMDEADLMKKMSNALSSIPHTNKNNFNPIYHEGFSMKVHDEIVKLILD